MTERISHTNHSPLSGADGASGVANLSVWAVWASKHVEDESLLGGGISEPKGGSDGWK